MVLGLVSEGLRAAMLAHAAEEAPRECCGLLVLDSAATVVYMRARNLYDGPAGEDRFTLDPADWAAAEDRGEVLAVVHSHPNASANPSMADRAMCERSGVHWVVMGWPSGAMVEIRPEGWEAPLEGRTFHFGVLDCYTLVQDWYRRHAGIELPDFEREDGFWRRETLPDGSLRAPVHLYRDNLAAAGFEVVQTMEPQPGDGLLMRIDSREVDNHAAVYLGNGMMLHHLYGQLSRKEPWDWAWQRRTTAIVRHRGQL